MQSETTRGKFTITGRIECISPLHVGSGSGEKSDMDILLGEDGRPCIPATSFIGVLRHTIRPDWDEFWGGIGENDGIQSAVRCSDLLCRTPDPGIVVRDGIRMDDTTGMVKDQGKFDYQILERGASFDLNMEFDFGADNATGIGRMVATILLLLKKGGVRIGGKTNSGLGSIRLLEDSLGLHRFDFSSKKDVFRWLTRDFSPENSVQASELGAPYDLPRNRRFRIDAVLKPKNALIIRSYSEDPAMPDAVHLQSRGEEILTGASLKGAIRGRASRIVKTLGKPNTLLTRLFGMVEDEKRSKNATKGKVRVDEVVLPKFVAELQTRIKIDRFTGGTVETALFDSMPLFTDFKDKVLNLRIEAEGCEDHEAGLLLLVLRDLWSGDLAVGGEKGIGRGTFEGISAIIEHDGKQTLLQEDFTPTESERQPYLQSLVNSLNSENHHDA